MNVGARLLLGVTRGQGVLAERHGAQLPSLGASLGVVGWWVGSGRELSLLLPTLSPLIFLLFIDRETPARSCIRTASGETKCLTCIFFLLCCFPPPDPPPQVSSSSSSEICCFFSSSSISHPPGLRTVPVPHHPFFIDSALHFPFVLPPSLLFYLLLLVLLP